MSNAMAHRYSRAVALSAPKLASQTPGGAVEGYWLDESRYYFLAERVEPSLGRVVPLPSIAHCEERSVAEVIPLEALAALLSEAAGRPIDLAALSSAGFDMPDGDTLAVSIEGKGYLIDAQRRCVVGARPLLKRPALYSPDGRYACFLKDADVWLQERDSGAEQALTTDGAVHWTYGQQSESCLAAVSYRKRPHPVGLWSRDSKWFLTHRIDERSVPELASLEHAPPAGGRPIVHRYKYPVPGDPLPVGVYVAIDVASGRQVALEDFPTPIFAYSPFTFRTVWFGEPDTVWFLRTDRHFKHAELIRLDLAQGTGRIVLSETVSSGYLEFHQLLMAAPNVRTLARSDEVIWFSERDGWGHLYLYDATSGTLKNRITGGEWLVRDIVHVDERARTLLFTACGVDPLVDPARRSLCSVNLDGSGFKVLRAHDGDIALARTELSGGGQDRPFCPSYARPGISPGGRYATILECSIQRGNVTRIVDLQTERAFAISSALPVAGEVLPRPFSALAADGTTKVHGVLFFPSDFDERRRYPLIDYIYPGPQVTQQPQSFRSVNAAQARALAELGFVTLMLDTRGMPFRSRALHQLSYGELLEPQLADHAAVIRELCARHAFIDGDRVGMIGYSGGGAATARALFDHGATFKVGVAVCGNHDNRFNIALWADKYCGPVGLEVLRQRSNATMADKLAGKLLLLSGDMDENVHVSQTLSLAEALIAAHRDFDLLIVPNAGHDVLLTSGYALRRAWDYFVRHLLGESPPADFPIEFEPHELDRFMKCLMREFRQ
jgi:dienelactone hydrolase